MLNDQLEDIITSKQALFDRRRAQTPILAVMALADMQTRPHPLLNIVTDNDHITLIGQVRLKDTYDPVAAALKAVRIGLDGVSLLTDIRIYSKGMEDLLLVSRGIHRHPVICQDYTLDAYSLLEVRASGASGVVLYAALLDFESLRDASSLSHRLKMNTIVNVTAVGQLENIAAISPHAISVGTGPDFLAKHDLPLLRKVKAQIPYNTRVLPHGVLHSFKDVEQVLAVGVDAIILAESLTQAPAKVGTLARLTNRRLGE